MSGKAPIVDSLRLQWLKRDGWKWVVQSFDKDGNFHVETIHKTDSSKDMEVEAIEHMGRDAMVRKT